MTESLRVLQIPPYPCGFCGLEKCLTQLKLDHRGKAKVFLTCPYHYEEMKYINAATSAASAPCTNIPIHCALCPLSSKGKKRSVWKYNMPYHLYEAHTENGFLPNIPLQVMKDFYVTRQEESAMGVGEEKTTAY
jgi:hypothetical protein